MAKPRVFISSTYYDLKYIRAGIEAFVLNLGYDTVLFEKGDIPFHHDATLEESCYREVDNTDVLVLIIGGRYGSLSKEDEEKSRKFPDEYFGRIRSVTNREYSKARERDIPIFIFVERAVFGEYETYKRNKQNETIKYVHVDDVRIYELIDEIISQRRNNFLKDFSNLEDITSWLRDQWAGIFSDMLRKKNTNLQIKSLEDQIRDLTDVVESLKKYNEEIIKAVGGSKSQGIIAREAKRTSATKAIRFSKEPMIKYIREDLFGKDGDPPSPERIFQNFLQANTLEDFLNALKLPPQKVIDLLQFDPAKEDFTRFKQRYGSEPLDLDINIE